MANAFLAQFLLLIGLRRSSPLLYEDRLGDLTCHFEENRAVNCAGSVFHERLTKLLCDPKSSQQRSPLLLPYRQSLLGDILGCRGRWYRLRFFRDA